MLHADTRQQKIHTIQKSIIIPAINQTKQKKTPMHKSTKIHEFINNLQNK